ncbi:transcriptional regulator sdnM [Colletotrichum liriopes]|uniref:Transcriptional regulator sdnM n=1 Tax=Colletotrichum liriopes TaxID=708192 RepID=A0AA37LQY9_9PEZI|nr:transcriptional regulator sdnM [Colletotrichum liriopes]
MAAQDVKGHAAFEVIPVPSRTSRSRTFFFLRHALDNDALKGALDTLIRHHWPKLGARLVTRPDDGFLEYHLPHTFPPDYKLFEWSSASFDAAMDEAAHVPKATAPEHGGSLETVDAFELAAGAQARVPGAPTVWVHVSTFTDGTVVGVNLPHALSDQLGLRNILKAWLGILKGEAPPPMTGLRDDVVSEAVPKSYSDLTKAEARRKGKVRVRGKREYFKVLMGFAPTSSCTRRT